MSQDQEIRQENVAIPEYAASRGARLEGILGRVSDAPLRDGNRLALLKNGPDTYDDWLAAIARAKRWVHLDNYIIANDEIGNRFADALSAKAAEGVRVRVLHDWFGCMDVPRSFWRGMREAGVEIKAVNPPASGPPLGVIRRDHRKLLAVDGEYASTGGVCIADGWMVRSKETGLPYRDTAVSVRGPVVADINRAFTSLWGEMVEELPDDERPEPGDIQAAGETLRAPGRPGTEQDAHVQDAGAPHGRGAGASLDNRPLLSLPAYPHPVADGHGARRGGREGPHAGHQRHSLDRQGLARGLQAVPGGGGQDLRVRRTHDPRQDHRGRRLVV